MTATDLATERWLDAPGAEGWYEVSDQGRVRRSRKARGTRAGYILAIQVGPRGYAQVNVKMDGRRITPMVHVLVAQAFLGPAPAGHEVDHRDRDRTHNHLHNLRWLPIGTNRSTSRLATHCRRGHPFTAENSRPRSNGFRSCRICYDEWLRRLRDERRRLRELLAWGRTPSESESSPKGEEES